MEDSSFDLVDSVIPPARSDEGMLKRFQGIKERLKLGNDYHRPITLDQHEVYLLHRLLNKETV